MTIFVMLLVLFVGAKFATQIKTLPVVGPLV